MNGGEGREMVLEAFARDRWIMANLMLLFTHTHVYIYMRLCVCE